MRLLSLAPLLLGVSATAQLSPSWQLLSTSGPAARYGHAMAYDSVRGEAVLFGGNVSGSYSNETWVYSNPTWTRRVVSGPSGRFGCTMAFDRARQVAILFGGRTASGTDAQTWSWNGSQWTLLQPAQSPAGRSYTGMAYDETRQRIVLFGGQDSNDQVMADTWEWDGSSWYPRFSAHYPTARYYHAMTYDGVARVVQMQGGLGSTGIPPAPGIWTWDGVDWSVTPGSNATGAPTGYSLAYHPGRRVHVVLAGNSGPFQTWLWNSASWTSYPIPAPGYRWEYSMIYHEAAGSILLFGGANGGAETWRLTIPNLTGGFTPYGQSCGPATVLAGASGTATRVGAPFTAEVRGIPATATGGVLWIGGSQSNLGPFPLPLGLAFTGMPGCFLYQDLLLSQPLTITGSVGSWSVPIPAEARFVGMRLYFQGFLLLPGANLAGTVVTHGAELLVGGY